MLPVIYVGPKTYPTVRLHLGLVGSVDSLLRFLMGNIVTSPGFATDEMF